MDYNFDEIIDRKHTASMKYDFRKQIFNDAEVVPMWVADMDFRTPDFIMDALRRRLDHEILGYTYMPSSFNRAAANWLLRIHKWEVDPSWICFSPGVVPALNMLVLAYTNPGDKIVVQSPVYFPFFSAVRNHGRILVNNPLRFEDNGYAMDLDDLEAKIDRNTRMLILCSPHNPVGKVWSRDVLEKLTEICLRNKLIIVSDEIHADLVFEPFRHIPTASVSDEAASKTVACLSPSKTFNLAGLSTSYLVIKDPDLRSRYLEILDHMHVGAGNIFGYVAMEAAYKNGEDWLGQLLRYLKGNFDLLDDFVSKYIPGIKLIQPEATYLAWLDCAGMGLNHKKMNELFIRQAGVGLSDGLLFGKEGKGFQRMNVGCPRSVLYDVLLKLRKTTTKIINNN